jgi:hypothetical protein
MALVVSAGISLAIPGSASAQPGPNSDLQALEVANHAVSLSPDATSVQAGTTQSGTRLWDFFLGNSSQTSVTNAAITVDSGWSPSLFPGISSFPVTGSQGNLAPGEVLSLLPTGALNSLIPVSFTTGYDSTRTVSPSGIPAGGGQQMVVITMTLTDARYTLPPDGLVGIIVNLASPVPGASIASTTDLGNLDQGEILQTATAAAFPFGLFEWRLGMPQRNKRHGPGPAGSSTCS